MAPMKRPAAASMGGAKKKPATVGSAVAKKCKVVADVVLGAEGLPAEVLQMLGGNLPESLGCAKEERHPFQEKVVGMVGEVLKTVETALQEIITAEEGKVAESASEKAAREQAEDAATALVKEKTSAAEAAAVVHLDSGAALKAAKEDEKAAEAALKAALSELGAAAGVKAKFESALNDSYMPMKESGDASKHDKCMGVLNKVGEEFGLNASLLTSLSSALAKTPEARGSFDSVCLQQVEDELSKLIADATAKAAAAETAKLAAEEKAAAAKAALEAATAANADAAAKESACKAAVKEAMQDLKAAQKAVKLFGPQMKQVEANLEAAKADLQVLLDGALAAFAELLERSAIPPPPPPAPPAEEATPAAVEAA